MIRILLVDDHASFRVPLAFVLEREGDIAVVAQAGSVSEARERIAAGVGIDVAIVDLDLPDGSGLEVIRALRTANPEGMVLILTASGERRLYAQAVDAGAAGVLHKSAELEEVVGAVRRLAAGETLLSPREMVELIRLASQHREQDRAARLALARLTPREREVLQCLADGLDNKAIAQRLGVSTETVRTHLVNLLGKLGVESRLQAVMLAARHGVIKVG